MLARFLRGRRPQEREEINFDTLGIKPDDEGILPEAAALRLAVATVRVTEPEIMRER